VSSELDQSRRRRRGTWVSAILEECASLLWATNGRPRVPAVLFAVLLVALAFEVIPVLGLRAVLGVATVLAVIALAATDVTRARRLLWVAATKRVPPTAATRSPIDREGLHAPTATALRKLAVAVDAARRGDARVAQEAVGDIDRQRLRPDEMRLLDAVRAVVSIHLGERERAARQAVLAMPTGSPDLDRLLGRTVFAEAWGSRARLRAIDAAWGRAGIRLGGDQTLSRLRRLLRIRLRNDEIDALPPDEARALSAEAEAIGDDELARDLDAASRRPRAYR
jgi:hypothetical protein